MGKFSDLALDACSRGALHSSVNIVFFAGGTSAEVLFLWPSSCAQRLASARARADLGLLIETAFDGWIASFSSIGSGHATIQLGPSGKSSAECPTVRSVVNGSPPGFLTLSEIMDGFFGERSALVKHGGGSPQRLGLLDGFHPYPAQTLSAANFVGALEAQLCSAQIQEAIAPASDSIFSSKAPRL